MSEKPIIFSAESIAAILAGKKTQTRRVANRLPHCPVHGVDPVYSAGYLRCKGCDHFVSKPPYQPGDILYVKETWLRDEWGFQYKVLDNGQIYYDDGSMKWCSPMYMPKAAARLFLRVTDVRAERLQDITASDAHDEGIEFRPFNRQFPHYQEWLIKDFHDLWDSLNAKRGYGWDTNPWVWVYMFEQIEKGAM